MIHFTFPEKYTAQAKAFSFRRYLPQLSLIMLIIFLNFSAGCYYYKISTLEGNVANMEKLQENYNAFFLHLENESLQMTEIRIDEENRIIYTKPIPVPEDVATTYVEPAVGSTARYKPREGNPTHTVHIYVSDPVQISLDEMEIPLDQISRIDVVDPVRGLTIASFIITTFAIVVAVFVTILIIALLTKSSCPFIYTMNDEGYQFTGELYPGAIYASVERDDYLALPDFTPQNGFYHLKIANELREVAYTDRAQLMVIEHPENYSILVDRHGNVLTVSSPQKPEKAVAGNGLDYTKYFYAKDGNSYLFNEKDSLQGSISSLTMTFEKPVRASSAKLVVSAKNSYWLDYTFGQFHQKFGTFYSTFAKLQHYVPAKQNIQWNLDQHIPLSVYVETAQGWEFVDYYEITGPLASRDLVMQIDLSKIEGDQVRIKLESGFMFWEVDYAAMDFSEEASVKINYLDALSAIDEKGKDVSDLLKKTDRSYLIQPETTNYVTMQFEAPEIQAGNQVSVFFHARGYYEYIRDYQHPPDLKALLKFQQKKAFTNFSMEKYMEMVNNKNFYSRALIMGYGN